MRGVGIDIGTIHFIGIGGIGMSGIAEVMHILGYKVQGSDVADGYVVDGLREHGIKVAIGHDPGNLGEAAVVVVSSAVKKDNPEVQAAYEHRIPVVRRAEMLAELMRLKFSIAVAGSHGKTTTTSMIALVLERAGLDPTAVIGGRLKVFGSNARLGDSEYMVAEADESDRSFLMLWPSIAVVTNIDREHMESYRNLDELQQAFAEFANKVPFYGSVVACADDANLMAVVPRLKRRVVTYGLDDPAATVVGKDIEVGVFGGRCTVYRQSASATEPMGRLELSVPGRHNLQNALAAVAVGDCLGLAFSDVAGALRDFAGAERRFERHGEADGVMLVDDYGHHPTEIAAVLAAARSALNRRLIVAFQPHRYSRTAQLFEEFGPALKDADEIVLTDIYAASEEPIPGITLETFAEAVRRGSGRPVHAVRSLDEVIPRVMELARTGDAVITLGAGSIGTLPRKLMDALKRREAGLKGQETRLKGEETGR